MAGCNIIFQDRPYTEEQFKKALKEGLLYNLLERKILDLSISTSDLGTSRKGFEQHFVSSKEDVKAAMIELFQLPEKEADAVSEIYDRVAFAWASRRNSSREKFYQTLTVFKGDQETLSKPALKDTLFQGLNDYTFVDGMEFEDDPDRDSYTVEKNGQEVGLVEINKNANGQYYVSWISRTGEGKGEGKNIFRTVVQNLINKGLPVGIDDHITAKGFKMMQELAKEGLLVQVGEEITEPNQRSLKPMAYKTSPFIVNPAVTKNNAPLYFQLNAWHGSPHRFDKFSMEKIGTGEGNQSFGHGLYFTDLKDVAQHYASAALDRYFTKLNPATAYDVVESIRENGVDSTIESYTEDAKKRGWWEEDYAIIDALNTIKKENKGSNIYEVTLHEGKSPDQYDWLQWDQKISSAQIKKIQAQISEKFGNNYIGDSLSDIMQYADVSTGGELYRDIAKVFGSPEDASEFLLSVGIDGIKYPVGTLAGVVKGKDSTGNNYVVFDENAVSIKSTLFNQNAQAAVRIAKDGRAILYALSNPNVSSPLHEIAHIWESQLRPNETQEILDWAGHDEWTRETSEKFARGFEKYLADGNAPTGLIKGLFEQFKEWLTNIYKGIVGSEIDLELNDSMKNIYAKMLGENYKTAAEQALAAEKLANTSRDKLPDTMERRKSEYVEPVVVNKKEVLERQMYLLNLPNKHLHPIASDANDYYGWASQISNALRTGTYVELLRSGEITEDQLRDILKSMRWLEDKEASDRIAEKNLESIVFKANELGATYSIQGLIDTPIDHPAFQNLVNYFLKSGKLEQNIKDGNITYEQAKTILDAAISQDVQTRDILEKLSKEVDDKVSKGKKNKKVVQNKIIKEEIQKEELVEKINEPEVTPVQDITPEPEVITPTESKAALATVKDNGHVFYNGQDLGKIEEFDGAWYQGDDIIGLTQDEAVDHVLNQAGITEAPVEEASVEEVAPSSIQETSSKYKVGDKVSYKGQNGTITEVDEDGFAVVRDNEGNRVGSTFLKNLSDPVAEPEKVLPERMKVSDERRKADREKKDMLERVAERMQQVMPSINFEIDYFNGDWKGRIKDGRVQINLNKATLDTPIHEFMHPFVLALRMSNYDLYTNLLDEVRFGQLAYHIDRVSNDPNYSNLPEHEREEEALVRVLAENIQIAFTERGQMDKAVVEKRMESFIEKFYAWFNEIWDKLWNVFNTQPKIAKQNISVMSYVTYNKETGLLRGFTQEAAARAKANLQLRKNEDEKIAKAAGEAFDPKSSKYKVEVSDSFRITDLTDKKALANRGITKEMVNEIIHQAEISDKKTVTIDVESLPKAEKEDTTATPLFATSVSTLPVTMTISDIGNFLIGQQKLTIEFSAEQTAIDKMNAYQHVTDAEAEEKLKSIKKRLEALADTGNRRIIDSQRVITEANAVKRILRDYDGVEAVAEYVRQGMSALGAAYQTVRYIQEELDADRAKRVGSGGFAQGQLTSNDINKLNRDLLEVRSMISFYNDVANLSEYIKDEFDKAELKTFERILANAEKRRNTIVNIATDLQAKWLYPYLENAQRNLPQDKRLTFEQFKRNLRFVDRDASSMTYWLGASINSRDPLTAILAVAVKDTLNQNHLDEIDKLNDIKTIYYDWQKTSGIPNTIGAVEDYYKKNFLRQAKVWEVIGSAKVDPKTAKVGDKAVTKEGKQGVITEINDDNAKINGYVERWAFHEQYFMDIFHDDFRKFKEGLPTPVTNDEWDAYNKRVTAWYNANEPTISKNGKYVNPAWNGLQNNKYFRVLYDTYKEGNKKYGERQLLYGIVPQAYKTESLKERGKNLAQGIGNAAKALGNKDTYTLNNAVEAGVNAANYVFDEEQFLNQKDKNLDGSFYRGVKSPFTHLIDPAHLDLRLNESVYGFYSAGNTFAALREVQANVENLKLLVEGNFELKIKARQIAEVDKKGKTVFDRFLKSPATKEAKNAKINTQLVEYINDVFYGDDEFQANFSVGKVNINLNKAGRNLGFITALTNMAGNVFAGVSNVTIGNLMSLGESVGGKYYNSKDWAKAVGMYTKSTPEFLADSTRPVKSKITQLAVIYDAIQGEFRDKYGKNITGNIMQKYGTSDTFFLINHVAEHQIQLTGMLALMNATKVKLKNGGEVTLFDAYEKNAKGFYKMRTDAIWSQQDENNFTRTLHGISKDLNGNYAAIDKGTIQRYWWGKLALQYRKYMYPAWRSRFSSERIDYERGTVEKGYYRTFVSKLWEDIQTYKFNLIGIIGSQANAWKKNGKGWTADQQYAHRKTMFDLMIVAATTVVAAALASMEAGDDDDDKWAKNALMLQMLRLRSDMSQFNVTIVPEIYRQVMNPSASLNTLKSWGDLMIQFGSPTETYKQNGSGYDEGESKLGHKVKKVIPLYRQYLRHLKPDEMVKYYGLINKDVDALDADETDKK